MIAVPAFEKILSVPGKGIGQDKQKVASRKHYNFISQPLAYSRFQYDMASLSFRT